MKRIYNSKIFWIIISLLISFVFWIYVTSVDSDVVRQTFRGVRVELVGESVLKNSKNLVVTDLSTSTVSIEVSGPRRVLSAMTADDLSAQIDVSKLSQSSYASMQYSVSYSSSVDSSGITVTRKVPDTINFTVSRLSSKTVPVRGSFVGSVAEGYTAEAVVFEPSEITVSGPESYLKNVTYAWVSFEADNISSTYTEETGFELRNSSDEPADTSGITCSTDVVTATLPILEMKELPLTVNLIYGAGANETNTKVTIEPSTITLAGDSAILNAMNNVPIASIDLSSFSSTFTDSYPISFDNSLQNIDGTTEAKVSVEVVGLETKTFAVSNIQCRGVAEGFAAEVLSSSISVKIRGTAEQLANIDSTNLVAVADLTDYTLTTGTMMINVKIQVDGAVDAGAVGGPYSVAIEIGRAG